MMKKLILLAFVAVMASAFAIPANAQLKFGVKGGVNIASVSFSNDVIDPSNVTGFQVGPMIEAMLPVAGFGFDAAVLYSQKGLEFENETRVICAGQSILFKSDVLYRYVNRGTCVLKFIRNVLY